MAVEVGIFLYVLAMLGVIGFSLVRIARRLGEIVTELKFASRAGISP